jgi:hypothetical protein
MVSNTVISNQIRLRRQRPGGRVASIALDVLQAVPCPLHGLARDHRTRVTAV